MQAAAKVPEFGKIEPGVPYVERPGVYAFLFNSSRELAVVQTSLGFFLPGGGVDLGESDEAALRRELHEEIGWELETMKLIRRANQYHWSEFYQEHFKKLGAFYLVDAHQVPGAVPAVNHSLRWMQAAVAVQKLSQEFQRWAVREGFGS